MSEIQEGALQLKEMVRSYEENLRALEAHPAARSEEIYHRFMKGYYERDLQALREGWPIVGSSGFIPAELFYALDLTPFLLEMHSCVVATQGKATDYLDVGEGYYGVSKEACSAHRVGVGLAKSGALPRPSFIVNTNLACDSIVKFSEILGTIYGCPTFPLDFAYGYEPNALEYNKQELASLIRFLEEQSGQRLDPERLEEVLHLSQEAHDYCARISELRKAVPCPRSSKNSLRDMTVMRCGVGTLEAVDYFRAVYEETLEKVARGEGAIPQERYRIAWFFTMPFFDLEILDWMEREHGAVVVMDTLSYMPPDIPLDPSNPLTFLVNSPLPGQLG